MRSLFSRVLFAISMSRSNGRPNMPLSQPAGGITGSLIACTRLGEIHNILAWRKSHEKAKREIRQLLFGKRPNVYRALFVIDNTQVRVIRVLRAQRRALTRRQIVEDSDPEAVT